MTKTKIFFEGFDEPKIDIQINKWIAKHPDYIVDIKLQSNSIDCEDMSYYVVRDALVIYREYENV